MQLCLSGSSLSPSALNIEVEAMAIALFNSKLLSVNIALIATLPNMVMTADPAGRVRSFVIARRHTTWRSVSCTQQGGGCLAHCIAPRR
jgi:hypothetical protein